MSRDPRGVPEDSYSFPNGCFCLWSERVVPPRTGTYCKTRFDLPTTVSFLSKKARTITEFCIRRITFQSFTTTVNVRVVYSRSQSTEEDNFFC